MTNHQTKPTSNNAIDPKECLHVNVVSYAKGKNSLVRACLDCGYTELSVGGIVVRRYFAAPIVFGFVKKAFESIENWVRNFGDHGEQR